MLLWTDGFDRYANDTGGQLALRYDVDNDAAIRVESAAGRFGGGAYRTTTPGTRIRADLAPIGYAKAAAGAIHCAVWLKVVDISVSTAMLFRFLDTGSWEQRIDLTAAGGLNCVDANGSGSARNSAAGVILEDTWHHVEVALKVANAGFWKVWVDGIQVVDFSGDTYLGVETPDQLRYVYLFGVGVTTTKTFFDDWIVWDESGTDFALAGPLPDGHRIDTLAPSGDDTIQLTRSAGSDSYALVDEPLFHNGDTDYVASTATGQRDLYSLTDQGPEPDDTYAVAIHARWKQVNAGTALGRVTMKTGSTEVESADINPTTAYTHAALYRGKNPTGDAVWASTDMNDVKAGVKDTSATSTPLLRVTQVFAEHVRTFDDAPAAPSSSRRRTAFMF